MKIKKYAVLLLASLCAITELQAQFFKADSTVFLPTHLSRVRALGLSGAVNAVEDDFGAAMYNPANYTFYQRKKNFRLTVLLNPILPAVVTRNNADFFGYKPEGGAAVAATVLSLIKAVNLTIRNVELGFIAGEPGLKKSPAYAGKAFLHAGGLYVNHFNTLTLNFRLAEQVNVGASVYLIYAESDSSWRRLSYGASYGILLKPKKYFRVGVSLTSLPAPFRSYRMAFDEIESDAINIGAALVMPWKTTVSLDVRNIALGKDGPREKYFAGLEQIFFNQIAIRGGVKFRIENSGVFSYSAGIGLLNLNALYSKKHHLAHGNFAINYAMLFEKSPTGQIYAAHAFSLLIRI